MLPQRRQLGSEPGLRGSGTADPERWKLVRARDNHGVVS